MYKDLYSFYRSKEWTDFRKIFLLERGDLVCENCHKPINNPAGAILHHKQHLNEQNVFDVTISLNESNIQLLCHGCHDEVHVRCGRGTRHTYLVYGPSVTKCLEFVKENAVAGDLICDFTSLKKAITHGDSDRTKSFAFQIRDLVLDAIKNNRTNAASCWIIGQYSYSGQRERMCNTYNAEPILIECDLETAVELDGEANRQYIEEWFKLNERS